MVAIDNRVRSVAASHSRTLSILLAVATLGLLYFVTWDSYDRYIARSDEFSVASAAREEKRATLDSIGKIRTALESPSVRSDLERYAGAFREDEILDSVFGGANGLRIASVTLAKGGRLPNGLSLADVSFSVEVPDIAALDRYLDYLTGTNGTKRYVIKSLTFPYAPDMQGPFNVGLALGMYYFE